MWSRLLDRLQTGCQQTHPKNQACTATTRQESLKEIGCLQAKQDSKKQALLSAICNHLGAVQLSSEDQAENWTVFGNAVHSSAFDTLGHTSRKHRDWFDENDEEIRGLLEEKHRLHKAHQDDSNSVSKKEAYNKICKTVQSRPRDMQDSWLSKKAEEIKSFANRKGMNKFCGALKTVYGRKKFGTIPLLSTDGSSLLTDKDSILKRCAEHFDSVLNRPLTINDTCHQQIASGGFFQENNIFHWNVLLDESPTVTKTTKVIQYLSSGNAPVSTVL